MIKRILNKLSLIVLQKTCEHKNKKNIWTDYQDRYYKNFCSDCRKTIYEDML